MLPVTMLTVRQFSGGRTARLALALSLIPALFAVIYLVRPWGITPNEFLVDLFRELVVPTLLPIVVLLPATAAFGNELEDGTLPYLLMKPVTRLRLAFGKYAAVLLVTVPALLVGVAAATLVASRGPDAEDLRRLFLAMAGASAAGAVLLGAVFLLVSLVVPRALLAGMIYIFAWESLLGRFLPGVQAVSSREYTLRVFNGLWDGDSAAASNAVMTMVVVAVVCLLLAVWRLRGIQIN
ncbi:MAG: ABC transporter permease [Chloroflexi bacterium]|nr:ABC transporter permease [Chloroflexota bacterium]